MRGIALKPDFFKQLDNYTYQQRNLTAFNPTMVESNDFQPFVISIPIVTFLLAFISLCRFAIPICFAK